MKVGDTRSKRRADRAVAAAFLSVLLASCTATTDGDPFGFASVAESGSATRLDSTATAFPSTASATEFVVDQGDPELPSQVAAAPVSNPAATTSAEAAPPPVSAVETASVTTDAQAGEAQAGDPAQLAAAQAGPEGQATEQLAESAQPGDEAAQQPEMTAAAPAEEPRKRGFLSGIFARKAASPAPQAVAQAQPETAAAETVAAAESESAEPAITEEAAQQTAAVEPVEAQGSADPAEEIVEGDSAPQQEVAAAPSPDEPKKRGFLSAFFSPNKASAAPIAQALATPKQADEEAPQALIDTEESQQPVIQLASTGPLVDTGAARAAVTGGDALPGVRTSGSLFEISRSSGGDDDSDVDVYEDGGVYQVASAAGLARLAPNGLLKQHGDVDVSCIKPSLMRVINTVERHFGKKAVVTSGYRDPQRNRRARGARNSLHMYCAAVDVQIPGVSKAELASFARSMPGRGGVGTYCHTQSVHIDVGPERDWNWRCRRRR